MRLALVSALVGLWAGCLVDITYPSGLACPDMECPLGQTCVGGFCQAGPGAADAGDQGDSGSAQRVCGGSMGLTDDFADDTADWWVDHLPMGSVDLGGAITAVVPDGPAPAQATAFSGPRLDLVDSRWFARVTAAEDATTHFGVQSGAEPAPLYSVSMTAGALRFGDDESGVQITYDPSVHQYWGLEETGGQLHFTTSSDGEVFTRHHSVASPDYIDRFQARMGVAHDGGDAAEASFDDINGGLVATHSFCKAAERRDDFEDGVVSDAWSQFALGCTNVTEEGGALRVVTPAGNSCVLATTGLHDLRDSQFEMELEALDVDTGLEYTVNGKFGRLHIVHNNGNFQVFDCPQNNCQLVETVAGAGERFWRFRGEGSDAVFEVSVDGNDFAEVGRVSSFELSATRVSIQVLGGESVSIARFN